MSDLISGSPKRALTLRFARTDAAALAADAPALGRLLHGVRVSDHAALPVALPVLAGPALESWTGAAMHSGEQDGLHWRADGDWLFAGLSLAEAGDEALQTATEALYRRMPELCAALGYAEPVKIWHYFAAINAGDGDAERYRRFCVGRASGINGRRWLAAATAVGVPQADAPLTVYWLASRHPVRLLENPRQTPAFEYPRAYGPVSPTFARAAWVEAAGQLFVSGTAAVVGHETRHAGDVLAQFAEIAANLQALVERAEREAGLAAGNLQAQGLKVYVRNPAALPALQASAAQLLPACPTLWLHGDISRRDLLVEVEGLYGI